MHTAVTLPISGFPVSFPWKIAYVHYELLSSRASETREPALGREGSFRMFHLGYRCKELELA